MIKKKKKSDVHGTLWSILNIHDLWSILNIHDLWSILNISWWFMEYSEYFMIYGIFWIFMMIYGVFWIFTMIYGVFWMCVMVFSILWCARWFVELFSMHTTVCGVFWMFMFFFFILICMIIYAFWICKLDFGVFWTCMAVFQYEVVFIISDFCLSNVLFSHLYYDWMIINQLIHSTV